MKYIYLLLSFFMIGCMRQSEEGRALNYEYSEQPTLFRQSIGWHINKVGSKDGTGKRAWIIDSGIDTATHDLNVDIQLSRSFVGGSPFSTLSYHGTLVAGVLAAKDNDIGVIGIASGATVVSLRVYNDLGVTSASIIIDALNYVQQNGSSGDVVTLTVVFDGNNSKLENAIKKVCSKGIKVVAAAGNNSSNISGYTPVRMKGVKNFYVALSIGEDNSLSNFSNFGNTQIYGEPGENILSLAKDGYITGYTTSATGTSMSCPILAGIVLFGEPKFGGYILNDLFNKTIGIL